MNAHAALPHTPEVSRSAPATAPTQGRPDPDQSPVVISETSPEAIGGISSGGSGALVAQCEDSHDQQSLTISYRDCNTQDANTCKATMMAGLYTHDGHILYLDVVKKTSVGHTTEFEGAGFKLIIDSTAPADANGQLQITATSPALNESLTCTII